MSIALVRACFVLAYVGVSSVLLGPVAAQDIALSKARMKVMVSRVKALRASDAKGQPIPLIEQPLFRYNDPIRATHDGIFAAWSQNVGRPHALIGLFTEPQDDKRISWSYEFISLSNEKLKITSSTTDREFGWSPQASELDWKSLPNTTNIPANPIRIRNHMKTLASRFKVTEEMQGIHQLRRLPKAMHEYKDDAAGIKYGAMFLFVYGTNPEAILVFECRAAKTAQALSWRYAFARATAAEIWAEFDDEVIWKPDIAWQTNSHFDPMSSYFIKGIAGDPITP